MLGCLLPARVSRLRLPTEFSNEGLTSICGSGKYWLSFLNSYWQRPERTGRGIEFGGPVAGLKVWEVMATGELFLHTALGVRG